MDDKCSVSKKNFGKITAFFLCAFIITAYMSALSTEASTYSGSCGTSLSWKLDTSTGVLTISGTGGMTDYTYSTHAPWYNYRTYITSVIIESGATSIGNYAFTSCDRITSASIPDTVVTIGEEAFRSVTQLGTIVIPEGVETIGSYAFNLSGLYDISLPSTLKSIGSYAFSNTGLVSVVLPEGITEIAQGTFNYCGLLQGLLIPSTVTSIGGSAFYGCSSLTTAVIPSYIETIEASAFYSSGLTSLTILNGVKSIGSSAFGNCSGLTSVTIPASVESIGSQNIFRSCSNLTNISVSSSNNYYSSSGGVLFNKDYTEILSYPEGKNGSSYQIPSGVETIGAYSFCNCTQLNSITLPSSLKTIENSAFYSCTGLTGITFPKSLTYIDFSAFSSCKGLTSVTIPDSVEYMGDSVFYYCTNLSSVSLGEGLYYIGNNVFYNTAYYNDSSNWDEDGVLYIDKCLIAANSSFTTTSYSVKRGTICIGAYAFSQKTALESVVLPNSIIGIGDYAFNRCTALTEISIGQNVVYVGLFAFFYCQNLTEISLPKTVTAIGGWAFAYCYGLTSFVIPENTTSLGVDAFYWCHAMTTVVIPKTVTTIGQYTFDGCSKLRYVYYSGTKEDWENVTIESHNEYLTKRSINYNYVYEYNAAPDEIGETYADEYMIDQVEKYTSSEDVAQFISLAQSVGQGNMSIEEYFRRLNELFANYGITDVQEGISYLTNASEYRHSYLMLTTNEVYCAYNWYYWLNTTTKGQIARGLLWADGLLLNGEVFDYLDVSTYVKDDYPGVEKNKALLKKILESDDSASYTAADVVNDTFKYSKKLASNLQKFMNLNDIVQDAEITAIMNSLNKGVSKDAADALGKNWAENVAKQVTLDKKTSVYFDGTTFSKALGYSSKILEFAGTTASDIIDIINLSNDIETYQNYEKFLTTIANNTSVSFAMRVAAYDLLDDIKTGYFEKVYYLISDIIKTGVNTIYIDKGVLETLLTENGASGIYDLANGAASTIKLATFISNLVVDTGSWVKEAAYTQGYAELAALYCNILEEDKQAFLADKSADNAWQFFEDYTILWMLRSGGEKQYLSLNTVKQYGGIWTTYLKDYSLKEDVVNDNLDLLDKYRFEISETIQIPSSVQYFSKAVMNCPVNVYVYTEGGELVAELIDGVESDITNEYGRFAVVKQSYSGEYSKIICQSTSDRLVIKAEAVDEGLVDYQYTDTDSTSVLTFDKVEVETGAVIEIADSSYTIDADNDGEADVSGDLLEKDSAEYVKVEGIALGADSVEICQGGAKTISLAVMPSNATNTAVDWVSADTGVAAVKNGVVYGVSAGETTIYVKPTDGDDICEEISVTVKPLTGICGDNAEWTVSGSALVISGTGAVDDFERDSAEWLSYKDLFDTVYVAEGITAIGENAFYGCESLKTAVVPRSVESTADTAFTGCTGIKEVYCYKDSGADDSSLYSASETAVIYYIGDVDFDKDVDRADGALMLKIAAEISLGEGISDYILDYSYDGKFNILDSAAVMKDITT
ncbi:MAG: leucine-rich repeat protein [Clostridiales bacterium]|nr:leucine-rich repeat protein [Clostridiales bacterium]